MFSLSQMTKVKLVCALAWRENFAKGNNSVTDTKRRMRDSPTLRQSTSWPSDREGHARGLRIIQLLDGSMQNKNAYRQAKRLCSGRPRLKSGKRDQVCSATSCPVRQQHEIRQKKGDKKEKARRRSSEPSSQRDYKEQLGDICVKNETFFQLRKKISFFICNFAPDLAKIDYNN